MRNRRNAQARWKIGDNSGRGENPALEIWPNRMDIERRRI
jgi:hypothetical protein